MINLKKNVSTRAFLAIIVFVQIVLHAPFMDYPPVGQHTWRQVMGLAPARNYFEEKNAFLYPTQDVRVGQADQGVTYFEFPMLYWLIGQSYHATGFSHVNGRAWMLAFGILLILGAYKFIRELGFDEIKARWYVFFLTCAPYFFYYSISVSPNLPALAWFTCGLGFLLSALKKKHWAVDHFVATACLTLGVISKSTYLFFGLPIAFIFIHYWLKRRSFQILLFGGVLGAIILTAFSYLYFHMQGLAETTPFERLIHLVREPMPFPTDPKLIAKVIRFSFNEWFLQMFVNSAAMFFFFTGLYQALKQKKWKTMRGGFWIVWGVSFFIFYFLFFRQFRQHAYYQTPLLLFAPAASAYGIQFFFKSRKLKMIALFLVVVVPMVMVGRVYKRWTIRHQVPVELVQNKDQFHAIIPKDDHVIVLGDRSPMIYLYYLHRKGIVGGPGFDATQLKKYQDLGFKWVVHQKGMGIDITPILNRLTPSAVKGDFTIYKILD